MMILQRSQACRYCNKYEGVLVFVYQRKVCWKSWGSPNLVKSVALPSFDPESVMMGPSCLDRRELGESRSGWGMTVFCCNNGVPSSADCEGLEHIALAVIPLDVLVSLGLSA